MHRCCAKCAIEFDRRLVPIEHCPFHSATPAITRNLRKLYKQRATITFAALLRLNEQIFEVKPGSAVSLGETIGWVEGFKATTDLFCVASGSFGQTNTELETDPTLLDGDPYGKGWLYTIEGEADASAVDAQGYVALLDLAIDKIQGKNGHA